MKTRISPTIKIWSLTILLIIGILALVYTSQRIIVKNTADAFNRQQLFLVRESARGIEDFVQNIETSLRTAADILAFDPKERICEAFFSKQQNLMQALFLVGNDGELTYSYPADISVLSDSTLDLKKTLAASAAEGRDIFIADLFSFQKATRPNLSFALGVPVPGKPLWICCIPDSNAIKERFIYPIRSGKTGYAWMIDRRGILLSHPNKEMEGRKAIDVLKELWPEHTSFTLEAIINQKMLKGEEGKGEYTGWHLGEKELTKKLIAYCPVNLKGVRWSIGVSTPYKEVMAPLMQSITGLYVFLACFIVIIIAGAGLLILQEKRKRLFNQELTWSQEVFDGITDGISIIDRDYRVFMVNRAVCEWQGKPQDFFKGRPCYQVFQQQESLCKGCPAKEAFETGKPVFRERVNTTLGGKQYYFHLSAFPLKDASGNTVKVAECVKDVTQEMELRSELIQHERKSMIVKMSAQIAHEIRNPLGTLTLDVDLLEDEINSFPAGDITEAKELVSTIKSELGALHNILQEYLECSRFPTITPDKQNINAILENMFSLFEEELRRKQITFQTSFASALPCANLDREQIRRAFRNIIINAVEAMEPGGTLGVTTRTYGRSIEVVFSDSGGGIPEDLVEKIFTPFFTTKSSGTGLGLAIAEHIVSEHKGDIICESNPGTGTRFRVRLPRWEESD
jgi:PAS domain S-box-containing protein